MDAPHSLPVPPDRQDIDNAGVELRDRLRWIVTEGTAPNTRRAYASDVRYWTEWCRLSGLNSELPLSPETVIRFIAEHVGGLNEELDEDLIRAGVKADLGPLAISTITRRVASLSTTHKLAKLENPCADPHVREILSRARKAVVRQGWSPRKKTAIPKEVLYRLLETCGQDLRGVRDEALMLFAWASGGRRRSEVTTAVMDRLKRIGDHFVYHLGLTKTTQDGEGGVVPITGRAARSLDLWLTKSGITEGPIFRAIEGDEEIGSGRLSDIAVARIVKKHAKLAGLDPEKFSAHSLRSGFMTEAGFQGIALVEAMGLSGHRSLPTASGYHQAGASVRNRAAWLLD